jgi:hypothetical protein
VLDIKDTTLLTQLLHRAVAYLETQQVTNDLSDLEKINLEDVFPLLERLNNQVDRVEIQRLFALLIELSVVRENPLLPEKTVRESRLIDAIQKTGRLGEFIRLLLV